MEQYPKIDSRHIEEIIKKAQKGNKQAKNELVKLMQNDGCMRSISRYLYINKLVEPDDIRSEFWLGVILALPKVRPENEPIKFLVWKGEFQVRMALRKAISQAITATCPECGLKFKLYSIKGEYKCRKCGSPNIETSRNEIPMSILEFDNFIEKINLRLNIDLKTFKENLTGQELKVYKMITEEGINRFDSKNYLSEISDKLHTSPQCINIYLVRIRKKLKNYLGS